jgi:DNA-3-methyladenine glycosylase II
MSRMTTATANPVVTYLDTHGPYDLGEVALMGFGHRDERSFDGVMRLAFCVDGDYERQVGVEVRQDGGRLQLRIFPTPDLGSLDDDAVAVVANQVARVISVDHDGEAFVRICRSDPVLSRLQDEAPGFRPALFYSPYEAAAWSIISARRARIQGITLRTRLSEHYSAAFDLAGKETVALPTPSRLLSVESFPGLPSDRIPRLHMIAEAAQQGRLSAERLASMQPEDARRELQQLPGIGPFYSSLIVVRACGHADVLPLDETMARSAAVELYGLKPDISDEDYELFAERWRPFRTWASVMIRAVGARLVAG